MDRKKYEEEKGFTITVGFDKSREAYVFSVNDLLCDGKHLPESSNKQVHFLQKNAIVPFLL
jgi:hypothetical protein